MPVDGWNIVFFHPTMSGIGVGLNGDYKFINSTTFASEGMYSNGASLRIGFPNQGDQYNYTFYGQTTYLFDCTANPTFKNQQVLDMGMLRKHFLLSLGADFTNVRVSDNASGSSISISNETYSTHNAIDWIAFGKLSPASYPLTIVINSLSIALIANSGDILIPVFFLTIIPYFVISVTFICISWRGTDASE